MIHCAKYHKAKKTDVLAGLRTKQYLVFSRFINRTTNILFRLLQGEGSFFFCPKTLQLDKA